MAEEITTSTTTGEGEKSTANATTVTPTAQTASATITVPAPQAQQTQPQQTLRTFTQEQLDAIIAREKSKAVKGWFSAEQMQAKESTITTLTGERDTERAEKERLQAELDTYKHEKFLTSKGVPADMVEFYAFKIGKLVTEQSRSRKPPRNFLLRIRRAVQSA